GVEGAPREPARHEEVPGALGGRARQHRGLDLHEALTVKIVPGRPADLIAEEEVPEHGGPAEVEVPVAQAERLDRLLALVEGEGEGLRLVQDSQRPDVDLDLPGREVRVQRDWRTELDGPLDGEDELGPDLAGGAVRARVDGGVEDELGDAVP